MISLIKHQVVKNYSVCLESIGCAEAESYLLRVRYVPAGWSVPWTFASMEKALVAFEVQVTCAEAAV